MSTWITRIARWVLGGWFLVFGALFLAARFGLPIDLPDDGNARGADFMAALRESGFIGELMYAGFFAGGLATLFDRTAPLGLVLTGNWPFGSFWMALFLALLWRYRRRFGALWNPARAQGRP